MQFNMATIHTIIKNKIIILLIALGIVGVSLVSTIAIKSTLGHTYDNASEFDIDDGKDIEFPEGFKFGVASSAYQIEGAWDVDGKGPSIWDTLTHTYPERIDDRSNGDNATLSYYLYKQDVQVLKELNANFYRFSISWPRILPTGDISSRNQLGIDYYNNLINELIANGIEPMVTMYHWDMPQPIQDLGGFMNPLFANYFQKYAELLFAEFGDRVKQWITFNEPSEYCTYGYGHGFWAPGIKLTGIGDYLCAHHTLLAHARVYRLYKEKFYANQNGRIGISLHTRFYFAKDVHNSSHIAARDKALGFSFGIYAHPLIHGDYPPIVRDTVDLNSAHEGRAWSRLPHFDNATIASVKGTVDFIGLNYYTSSFVAPAENNNFTTPSMGRDMSVELSADKSWPHAKSGWIYSVPEGLYHLLIYIKDHYNNTDVFITENGWSDDGRLDDIGRVKYMREHFTAVYRALLDGCKVLGHSTWSIFDNFEWLSGYTKYFGVYRVDSNDPERKRVAKTSAKYLAEVFETGKI